MKLSPKSKLDISINVTADNLPTQLLASLESGDVVTSNQHWKDYVTSLSDSDVIEWFRRSLFLVRFFPGISLEGDDKKQRTNK